MMTIFFCNFIYLIISFFWCRTLTKISVIILFSLYSLYSMLGLYIYLFLCSILYLSYFMSKISYFLGCFDLIYVFLLKSSFKSFKYRNQFLPQLDILWIDSFIRYSLDHPRNPVRFLFTGCHNSVKDTLIYLFCINPLLF